MKKLRKFLCTIGLHAWEYNEDKTKRWCKYCGIAQELWVGLQWEECVDGVPIRKERTK